MNIVKIPKKTKGEFREIAVLSSEEKSEFLEEIPHLNEKCAKLCGSHVHGFIQGRSPVTNAKAHIGYAYSLSFDLSNFFDTVKPPHLKGLLTNAQVMTLLPNDRAYQGLPSSPAVANLAAIAMDNAVLKKIKNKEIVFTRYADDLTFSFNDFSFVDFLKKEIPQAVRRCGFFINTKKTRLQDSRYGNRTITGVSVGQDKISVNRKFRRKMRAAKHKKNMLSFFGMREWSKLKEPNPNKENVEIIHQSQMNVLTKLWKIRRIRVDKLPKKETTILEDDVIISGDPIYALGISNWVTNWTSCMYHPSGAYHRTVTSWPYLKGTRVAMLCSDETLTIAGFTRKKMRARTLVHTLEDGRMGYDTVYGESYTARSYLIKILEKNNIFGIGSYWKSGQRSYVQGRVPKRLVGGNTPYLDSLDFEGEYDDNGVLKYFRFYI